MNVFIDCILLKNIINEILYKEAQGTPQQRARTSEPARLACETRGTHCAPQGSLAPVLSSVGQKRSARVGAAKSTELVAPEALGNQHLLQYGRAPSRILLHGSLLFSICHETASGFT